MWTELTKAFQYPEGTEERAKKYALQQLGTKEHGGHVRGVSSKLNWKQGFPEDAHMYKKHDRYKQTMWETAEEVFVEKIKDLVQAEFVQLVQTCDEQQVHDILQSSRPLAPPVI